MIINDDDFPPGRSQQRSQATDPGLHSRLEDWVFDSDSRDADGDLAPAKGIVIGALMSIPIWIAIAFFVMILVRLPLSAAFAVSRASTAGARSARLPTHAPACSETRLSTDDVYRLSLAL
jgi:hypothetical protein